LIVESEALRHQPKKRKKKQTFRPIYFWLKFVIILAILLTSIVFMALSPFFNINAIEVNGTKRYSSDALADLSGIISGKNGFKQIGSSPASILMFRFGNAEKILRKECPYIKEVKVRYIIPSKAVIDIVERTVFAVVPCLGTSLLVDNDGYVLESVSGDEKQNVLVIKGLKISGYKIGGKLADENSESFRCAKKVIDAVHEMDKKERKKLFEKIDSVDVSNLQKVYVVIESRVVVNLGNLQDLNYRISTMKTIFEKNIKKNEKGMLDFTSGENPVFTPESGG